jgi:hypothetical protein
VKQPENDIESCKPKGKKEIQETLPDIASRRNWKLGDWS